LRVTLLRLCLSFIPPPNHFLPFPPPPFQFLSVSTLSCLLFVLNTRISSSFSTFSVSANHKSKNCTHQLYLGNYRTIRFLASRIFCIVAYSLSIFARSSGVISRVLVDPNRSSSIFIYHQHSPPGIYPIFQSLDAYSKFGSRLCALKRV